MDAANKLTGGVVGAGVAQRDAFQDITEATQLGVDAAVVHCTANATYTDWTLTLPSVAEAAGRIISIYVTIADAQTVTVEDKNNDTVGWTDLDMDADGDYALLYSDGVHWCIICNGIA